MMDEFSLREAEKEYGSGFSITMDPAKRLDVIMNQIFPEALAGAEEGYDCAKHSEKKIERNYMKAKEKLIPRLSESEAEAYAKLLEESYIYHKSMLMEKKNYHLKNNIARKASLDNGEALNYEKNLDVVGRSGTPYQFDGRAHGVLFRKYKDIVNQDDVKMLDEASRDCSEDVLMKAVLLTPEAEELAEQLGVLVEYHTPECLGCD
jgi:hypothetical protein